MLPQAHRLRSAADFRRTTRRGRRAARPTLVAHLLVEPDADSAPATVGFVVSKAVGPAVVRTRVKRRLRHLARERLTSLPGGSMLVVRANPAAASASSAVLASDLDRALETIRAAAGASVHPRLTGHTGGEQR